MTRTSPFAATALLILLPVLSACDSNLVGPEEPAARTVEVKYELEPFQAVPNQTLSLDRGEAIVASGRDTTDGN